ncbi:MAG: type II toxin-antitoxin system Phd/YefM family antitoxin [Deltaproteobacteria bacterium]|nr:type II toxin-antitoxin system Phd/YefM family antitoxin [Deltaproteobacteria bacterium]
MKTMAISQFKAHALKIIDEISQNHEPIIVTKRGKPLAKILPYKETSPSMKPGQLADTLIFEEDIITPLGENMWEACS